VNKGAAPDLTTRRRGYYRTLLVIGQFCVLLKGIFKRSYSHFIGACDMKDQTTVDGGYVPGL
jgi:hypothetical protein